MQFTSAVSTALCLLALVIATADAAVVSTASHYATTPSDANLAAVVELLGIPSATINRRIAQTFMAGTTGAVQSVSVTAGARNGVPVVDANGLSVSLATVVGGQPTTILGSAPVQNVEVLPTFGGPFAAPTVQQAMADFSSQGITLEAGTNYALIFSADAVSDSFLILGGHTGYPDGALGLNNDTGGFGFPPTSDLFFDVTVVTIPEPTSLALAAMLAGCGMMGRRRQR